MNNIGHLFTCCLFCMWTIWTTTTNDIDCLDNSTNLKLSYEEGIISSLGNLSRYLDRKKNVSTIPRRLEASGVVLRPDHEMIYVVFDNTFLIGAFCNKLFDHKQNCTNSLLSWDNKTLNKLDSEFEGIAYNPTSDTYFIVQETVPSPTRPKEFNSNVYEISIDPENVSMPISMVESCSVVWTFSSSSKGFEGLEFAVHQLSGKGYLLALCESNNCGKKIIDDVNGEKINEGHIVVLEKRKATQKNPCRWMPVGTIRLPSSVSFTDYSGLEIYRANHSMHMAVTSQENSELWIGMIEEINESPYFRILPSETLNTYKLPRKLFENSSHCDFQYCNIEGVTWINEDTLILVSDVAKVDQSSFCQVKQESIHYFSIPETKLEEECLEETDYIPMESDVM